MSYVRSKRYPELFKPAASSVWWAFLPNPDGGRARRESTKLRDERAAHAWYLTRIRTPDGPTVAASPQKERSLRDALAARVEWLKSARQNDDKTRRKLAAATIDFYDKKSAPLLALLGRDTLLSAIGHEQIREYIIKRSATAVASTIAKELTTLSMAMRLARKDGVACPVFADIKPDDFGAMYVPKTRWCPEDEASALVFSGVLPPRRAAVVAFIVATSSTYPSEVDPVERTMVDAKRYVVHIPGKKRGSRKRTIVVPTHARRFFDYAIKHATGINGKLFEPWHSVRRDLHVAANLLSMCAKCRKTRLAWARHAGGSRKPTHAECAACKATRPFAPLSPNDLRRTFAQWLVRSGVPNELVSPMMGHKDTRMVERVYGKRDATSVAELVELALKQAPKTARHG